MGKGYKTILQKGHPHANSGGHVLEHIVVAERTLGRLLKHGETVHHIDKNKLNNSPSNLIVFATTGDHTLFHSGCEIYKDGDVWRAIRKTEKCPACGKQFYVNGSRMKYKTHYCCRECKMSVEKKQVGIDEIVELIYSANGNFSSAAKEIGISANAIAHRLKRAGLPYHAMDYRNSCECSSEVEQQGKS